MFTLVLTSGAQEKFEYTAYSVEGAARGAVANFQKQNPTKRVEYALLPWVDGIRKWLPHLEGWEHDQPEFIKAVRRDGDNPVDGTEI